MSSATAPANDSYWDQIAFFLRHALSLFGDPAKLAQQLWISARDHKLFRAYIRPLEHAVRQLIFIAALELKPATPATPERKYKQRLGMAANTGAAFDETSPESWRVSFKLDAVTMDRQRPRRRFSWVTQARRRDAGGPYDPSRISSAPSAQRLEALIRAYEQRDKYAAALARKLARNARLARTFTVRRKPNKGPAYVQLDFCQQATDAHARFIAKNPDAVLRADSS